MFWTIWLLFAAFFLHQTIDVLSDTYACSIGLMLWCVMSAKCGRMNVQTMPISFSLILDSRCQTMLAFQWQYLRYLFPHSQQQAYLRWLMTLTQDSRDIRVSTTLSIVPYGLYTCVIFCLCLPFGFKSMEFVQHCGATGKETGFEDLAARDTFNKVNK